MQIAASRKCMTNISSLYYKIHFWLICCCCCCGSRPLVAFLLFISFYLYIFNLMCRFKLLTCPTAVGGRAATGEKLRFIVGGCIALSWEKSTIFVFGATHWGWCGKLRSSEGCGVPHLMHELSICLKVARKRERIANKTCIWHLKVLSRAAFGQWTWNGNDSRYMSSAISLN